MDTSKEYVDMCFKSRELQDLDKPYKPLWQRIEEGEIIVEYQSPIGILDVQIFTIDQLKNKIKTGKPYQYPPYSIYFRDDTSEKILLVCLMKYLYNKTWNGLFWSLENE